MTDYKKMCEKLLRTHYILKDGLAALAKIDKYGDLSRLIWLYFDEFDRIDKRITPFPQKAKIKRIPKNNQISESG